MLRKYFPYIILISFSIIGLTLFVLLKDKPTEVENDSEVTISKKTDDDVVEESVDLSPEVTTPGKYTDYSFDKLSADRINVIFFAASWCPTCQELDSKLNQQLDEIPSNLQILKADYDKETSLRQKYGVTYQHTLVQVDKNGNKIKSWSGGYDLESITSQVN